MIANSQKKGAFTLKGMAPVIIGLLLILIFRLPLRTGEFIQYVPYVSIAFVYYWVLNGRQYTPYWAIFLMGIFEDMVTLGPAGLNSVLLLIMAVGLTNQRRFFINRPFLVGWMGFMIIGFGITVIRWLLESFYANEFLSPTPLGVQFLSTILFYPVLGAIFGAVRQWVRRR